MGSILKCQYFGTTEKSIHLAFFALKCEPDTVQQQKMTIKEANKAIREKQKQKGREKRESKTFFLVFSTRHEFTTKNVNC